MMVETEAGQFTEASDIKIDLVSLVAGDLPIRRLFFYAPGFPNFPRLSFDALPGLEVIFKTWVCKDSDYFDLDQSYLAPEKRVKTVPLRYYKIIGFRVNGQTVVQGVDLKTGLVRLDLC